LLRKIGIINSVLVVCLALVLFISGLAIAQETDLFIQAQKARQQGDTDSAYRLYEQAAEQVTKAIQEKNNEENEDWRSYRRRRLCRA